MILKVLRLPAKEAKGTTILALQATATSTSITAGQSGKYFQEAPLSNGFQKKIPTVNSACPTGYEKARFSRLLIVEIFVVFIPLFIVLFVFIVFIIWDGFFNFIVFGIPIGQPRITKALILR